MSKDTDLTWAFIAGIRQVEKAFLFADLAGIRRQRIRAMAGTRSPNEFSEKKSRLLASLVPVFKSEKSEQGKRPIFVVPPFYYAFKVTESPYLPFIEACEIPILDFQRLEGTLEVLENCLANIGHPQPISVREQDLKSPDALWQIRREIVREAFMLRAKQMTVYLTVVAPEQACLSINPQNDYLKALSQRAIVPRGVEQHRKRIVPVSREGRFNVLELECFLMTEL